MASRGTVVLKGDQHRYHGEAPAYDGNIKPGYLLQLQSDGDVRSHQTRGGKSARWFAKENYLEGKTVSDAYATDDVVLYHKARPGDVVQAVLKAGENVSKGDYAISYGDGTVCKAASSFLANSLAASSTVTNTVTETTFSTGTVTIPENTLKAGDMLRVRLHGTVPSTNSTDTLNIKLKIGSTVIAQTAAFNVTNSDVFLIDASIIFRTIGASGTMVANALTQIGIINSTAAQASALASTSVDTTGDLTMTVTATWSVAHADNQCALQSLVVEHVKSGTGTGNIDGVDILGHFTEALDLSAEEDNDFIGLEIAG